MDDSDSEPGQNERVTAPMQDFTTTQVGLGFGILLVGLVIVFGIPLAFF